LISMASLCKQFNALPGPGGILDQDPYLIDGMSMVYEAVAEKEERESKRGSSN